MKKNYRFLLFLSTVAKFIALPDLAFAQKIYEGQVLDKTSELPLPSTTVTLLKQNISVKVNDQGYFKLLANDSIIDDVLVFTFIGYKTYEVPIKNYNDYLYIKLEPTIASLNEVKITAGKRKELTLEKFSLADIRQKGVMTEVGMIINYQFTAKLFKAPVDNTKLLRIQSGRRDFANYLIKANNFAKFILHIMEVNKDTGGPGEVLFSKEVILQDNSHIFSVDFSKDNVTLPSKFFIAVERLSIPFNEVINVGTEKKVAGIDKKGKQILEDAPYYFITYQPFIAMSTQLRLTPLWYKINGVWKSGSSGNRMALSATIFY